MSESAFTHDGEPFPIDQYTSDDELWSRYHDQEEAAWQREYDARAADEEEVEDLGDVEQGFTEPLYATQDARLDALVAELEAEAAAEAHTRSAPAFGDVEVAEYGDGDRADDADGAEL